MSEPFDGIHNPVRRTAVTADKEGPEEGHTFLISYQSRSSSKVVGETDHHDAPDYMGPEHFTEVRAWSLREALEKAARLDFNDLMTRTRARVGSVLDWSLDEEECDACFELDDLCPFHRGVAYGIGQMAGMLIEIGERPELLNKIRMK